MEPIYHSTNNMTLGPPKDVKPGECQSLSATMTHDEVGRRCMVSFWKPTPEELALLNSNGSIGLWVFGQAHPMVWITAEASK